MCVQVDFSNRDSNGKVVSVGGRGGGGWLGQPWRLSVARVLALMKDPKWVFFTVDTTTGARALVRRVNDALTTSPDGKKRNNLDVLPGGNLDLPETEPAFPERPYLRPPTLGAVFRGKNAVAPLRGGSFPVEPAPVVGIRFDAPWPAALEVTVNGTQAREVTRDWATSGNHVDLEGWYYVDEVTGLEPGQALQTWTIRVSPPWDLHLSPVRITVRERTLSPRCMTQPTDDRPLATALTATYRTDPLRIETGRSTMHPDIWSFDKADREELAFVIGEFLTSAVLAEHHNLDHTVRVVDSHRFYLSRLEAFLRRNGFSHKWIPLPCWNPTDGIPDEFRRVVADAAPITDSHPNISLPAQLRPPALCGISTVPELWENMRVWHNEVHAGVGGAMRTVQSNSPAAVVFWLWHAYVDNIYTQWELCG